MTQQPLPKVGTAKCLKPQSLDCTASYEAAPLRESGKAILNSENDAYDNIPAHRTCALPFHNSTLCLSNCHDEMFVHIHHTSFTTTIGIDNLKLATPL